MSDLSGDDDYDGGVDGDDVAPSRKRRASAGANDGEKKPRVARPKKKGGRRRKKKDSDDDEEDEIEESEPEPYDEDDFVIDHEPVVKDTTLYCSCRQTYNPRRPMVGCDSCNEWYHLNCVGLKKADAEAMPTYECTACTDAKAAGRPIIRKPDAPSDGTDDGSIQHGVADGGVAQHHVDPNVHDAAAVDQQAALAQHQALLAAQYPGYANMAGAGRPMVQYPGYTMIPQQPVVQQPVAQPIGAPAPAGQPLTFGQLSEADKEKYRRQLALRNQQMQQQQAQAAAHQQALMQQQQMIRAQQAQAAAVAGNGISMGGVGVMPQGVAPQMQQMPVSVPVTSAPPAAEQQVPTSSSPAPVEQVAAPVQ